MSTIYEIFGFRLNDYSEDAKLHRSMAWCPFMNAECDGGGNRYLTTIDLTKQEFEDLQELFPDKDKVIPGICSLEPTPGQMPWIVCPRRLLVLGRQLLGERSYQRKLENKLLSLLNYPSGTKLGVWKEVKVQHTDRVENILKKFDYTFDYILMPIIDVSIIDTIVDFTSNNNSPVLSSIPNDKIEKQVQLVKKKGFKITEDQQIRGGYVVHDYPAGHPTIVEIMTSSTSGGNKNKRTQIAQAFEDAMLGRKSVGPGINYRQVWARMASQLLVKSEVALGWNGVAVWVLQDVLIDYISSTTGLNVSDFIKEEVDEVNMLSFSYGDRTMLTENGVIDLPQVDLFAGPVAPVSRDQVEKTPSFIDIIRLPIQPPISKLIKLLSDGGPVKYQLIVPDQD